MSKTQFQKTNITVDIIEFIPDSVVYKTTIKNQSGTINTTSVDAHDLLSEINSPYDNFLQIVEGLAEIEMNKQNNVLESGQGVVVPAHQTYSITSKSRFKMIMTVLKTGNES